MTIIDARASLQVSNHLINSNLNTLLSQAGSDADAREQILFSGIDAAQQAAIASAKSLVQNEAGLSQALADANNARASLTQSLQKFKNTVTTLGQISQVIATGVSILAFLA